MLTHLDAQRWQEDVSHLADKLRSAHRDAFHTVSPEAFDRAVRALHRRIPSLAGHEVVVELARLVALIGDGHTRLQLNDMIGFQRYPITFYRFSNGLFVRAVAREHAAVAGARLIAIDETPVDEAYERLRPLVSRDNEMGVAAMVPTLLGIPEVLRACGVVRDPERATFALQRVSGEVTTLILQPTPTLPTSMADAADHADQPAPLWLRQPEANWFEHLPEHDALYVGLNHIRDSQHERLATFFDRVFALIERASVDRLVLDLRRNGGGNNLLNRPLIHHLIRSNRVNRWGSLFAIVGRLTFSAAMNLAVDLERHTRVLFVGEPTGASPNHYGENGVITLPHSGLHVTISTLWWQYSVPYDDRQWIAPDIPARLAIEDYAANHDPSVHAALNYAPGSLPPLEYPDRLFAQLRLNA